MDHLNEDGVKRRVVVMTQRVKETKEGVFVLPVVSPAVPLGSVRLRATVTAAYKTADIE
jgi:7-keto-8-aminopelargonate synthetase-like enzyme